MKRRAFFALAVALVACTRGAVPPPSHPHPLQGQPVPDFQRVSLRGEKVDTASLRGRVVVVKFFAKYCEPCKRTLPAVQRMHVSKPEVAFVGVAEDEYAEQALEVVSTYALSFPVVFDVGNVLAGRFRVSELPITFVVDRGGRLAWIGGPMQTEDDLAAAIAAVK